MASGYSNNEALNLIEELHKSTCESTYNRLALTNGREVPGGFEEFWSEHYNH